ALETALDARAPSPHLAARRAYAAEARAALDGLRTNAVATASKKAVATTPWIAACLNDAKDDDDIVVTEMAFPMHLLDFPIPRRHFGLGPAGGLGWGLGEAIGQKLANPDRRVIAIVGDGSYMFGNPTPAHFVCEAMGLPILTIIVNNGMWGAVRRATLSMYPDGAAATSNAPPLTMLRPSPRFEKVVEASGGWSECVENAADLPAALERALKVIETEGRQAILNVLCEYADAAAAADAMR
ncbi:MAG: thiamine pyrophosphate-dependent enzyme, partial [Rhodospirillaceae bacterium]